MKVQWYTHKLASSDMTIGNQKNLPKRGHSHVEYQRDVTTMPLLLLHVHIQYKFDCLLKKQHSRFFLAKIVNSNTN